MKKTGNIIRLSLALIALIFLGFTHSANQVESSVKMASLWTSQQQKKEVKAKVVYTCPMHQAVVQNAPGKCPSCGMKLEKKEVPDEVYTCSMHPTVLQGKPGKCPKCGMKLTKKEQAKKPESVKK